MEDSELELLKVQHPAAAQEISEISTSLGWEGQQRKAQKPLHLFTAAKGVSFSSSVLYMGGRAGRTKAELAARWSLQEKLLAQGKGRITLSAQEMHTDTQVGSEREAASLQGWCPAWDTHSPGVPHSPSPRLSLYCNCVNIQYFAHIGIRVIFHLKVALAGHVLPLPSRAEVKGFTRKEGKTFSVM